MNKLIGTLCILPLVLATPALAAGSGNTYLARADQVSALPAANDADARDQLKAQMRDEWDKLKTQQKDQRDKLKAQQKDQRDKLKADQKTQRDKLKADHRAKWEKVRQQAANEDTSNTHRGRSDSSTVRR
jgi:Skp family chaperone for outer membrane proteins